MRNNAWLLEQLDQLLSGPFQDMERPNQIRIEFSRKAKRRLGSIRMSRDKKESRILINGIFRDPAIPEQIIYSTIAHELCHYAHGFCSPLPQKYKHAHQGGVIGRELKKRGLHLHYDYEKQWLKNHWPRVLGEHGVLKARIRISPRGVSLPKAMGRSLRRLGLLLRPE